MIVVAPSVTDSVTKGATTKIRLSESWPPEVLLWRDPIERYAEQYAIDPNLIAAVMMVESGGNPNARSRAGAIGLMQVMKRFHSCASFEPVANILCGTHLLAYYQQRAGGDWRRGLAFYNCGETGVKRGQCGSSGGWAYADKVIALYQKYDH